MNWVRRLREEQLLVLVGWVSLSAQPNLQELMISSTHSSLNSGVN